MTPLTVNPSVVVLLNPEGTGIKAVATNVASDLNVIVTRDEAEFKDEALNKPFDSTRN